MKLISCHVRLRLPAEVCFAANIIRARLTLTASAADLADFHAFLLGRKLESLGRAIAALRAHAQGGKRFLDRGDSKITKAVFFDDDRQALADANDQLGQSSLQNLTAFHYDHAPHNAFGERTIAPLKLLPNCSSNG